ncbi:helix-turn-helix domain-containing protein [Sporolactobacillus spathodeae]|uniref:YSIRK-targeted surface antigen transcriptional regulator n=1 Tax=Sporolactobacillus spathodeae TaxID=1465502 RepID=A0ABS2Q9E1_9BACL|nr:helix-turn-helix domain-containing protein [Sporolactobacillus spathodeae]MBM7658401.1 YSIRK-targeted surface antigen transcriptional regulator [Sporolactobacillus spathodeae]
MQNIYVILAHIYQATGIPIYLYDRNTFVKAFSDDEHDHFLPPKQFIDYLTNSRREIDYLASDFFAYFGSIEISSTSTLRIIVGPAFQMNIQQDHFRELIKSYVVVEQKEREEFSQFISNLPVISLNRFLNILKTIHFFINQKEISTETILKSRDKVLREDQAILTTYENRENLRYNNSYNVENRLCGYVEHGDLEKILEFIEEPFQTHEGKMAQDSLRQAKNTAIVSITLITRAAIRGGVDTESAFQISDRFIQQIEQFHSLGPIQHLIQEVLFDLTNRVRKLKLVHMGSEFLPLIRYIERNVNQPLSVTLLAEKFGYSRSHLSTLFKKTNGITLQNFITKCKMEEAKQLLTYTDKAISTISNYLRFSSQSHFQTVFKQYTGQSPAKYRKNTNHIKEF